MASAGYLGDDEAADLYKQAQELPEGASAVHSWQEAWSKAGLPPKELSVKLLGPIFVPGPEEPLLPEDRRVLASDPKLYQLVFYNVVEVGLDVKTFESMGEAEEALAALKPDEYGEGGGILVRDGKVVAENLFLKYMTKGDYVEYLDRATQPPAADNVGAEEKLQAALKALQERLGDLQRLAPEIAELKEKYEGNAGKEPKVIHGRPSQALAEFASLFPGYVVLGGCNPKS